MKKYVLTVLLFAVVLSLTACSLKSSQSSNGNSPQNSANTVDEKTDELSVRLKQYESFLKDEISSENGSEGAWYLRNFCNLVVPEETEDGIRYALFDMTGDELPELHVLTDISYSIHTIENNQLITWYTGDRYNRPLNNRAILQKVESVGISYSYIVLDSKGQEVLCISFGDPQGQHGQKYFFDTGDDEIELSKSEWDKLTRPFLTIGSDKIVWKNINDLDLGNIEHDNEKLPESGTTVGKTTNKWFDNTEKVAYKGDFTTSVERTDTLDCNIKNLYIGESPKGSLYQMLLDVPDVAKVSEELLNIGFFYFENDRIYRMLELSQDEQSKLLKDGEIPDSATIVCQDEEIKDKNNNKGWHERIDRNEDVVEYYRWNDENTTNFYEHIFWKENIGIILYRRGYAAEIDSITMWREEYVSNPHE